MDAIADFLSFRSFISPSLLIFFYYLGALGVPLFGWLVAHALWRRLREGLRASETGRTSLAWLARRREVLVLWIMFAFAFLAMEIGWRMMFEFMLAYFQMRDLLFDIAAG